MNKRGLTLSPILCDGMVLQRDAVNHIYGTETEADEVTVSFIGVDYIAKVDKNFDFCVDLPPVVAGGPYSLTIKGSSTIILSDILFGEVYLLSGQSNMELPVKRVLDVSAEEIQNTCEPTIRQYVIPATFNFKETEKYMLTSTWEKAEGEALMSFSAAGYFFAKEIKEKYQVPVGLIMTAVGGSCIEAWMNPATLSRFGDYNQLVDRFKDKDYFTSYIQDQQDAAFEWASRLEKDEQVNLKDYKEWKTCMVPSLVSDYGTDTFNGSVYLCREVLLDGDITAEDAYIYMGSIIDSDKVWINGKLVGSTEYRYPPRKYPISKGILKKGSNLITVRILINHKNGGTIKDKPYHLFFDGQKIDLVGKWYYKVGAKSETEMPDVLFPPNLPIGFYNATIVPLSKIAVKGILWYQGETNANDPDDYAEKFTAMVNDWRELFHWNVPFIYVQLANYREPLNSGEDTGWAELRNQQRLNLYIPNVAMVVTMDIGEPYDLHPQNKKEVGVRLSKAARHLIYQESLQFSGPIPRGVTNSGRSVEITFDYLEDTASRCQLNNFELASQDRIYYAAFAERKGNRVYVSCNQVDEPRYVRYAWCDNPTNINFYNDAGLPATGFRLDI